MHYDASERGEFKTRLLLLRLAGIFFLLLCPLSSFREKKERGKWRGHEWQEPSAGHTPSISVVWKRQAQTSAATKNCRLGVEESRWNNLPLSPASPRFILPATGFVFVVRFVDVGIDRRIVFRRHWSGLLCPWVLVRSSRSVRWRWRWWRHIPSRRTRWWTAHQLHDGRDL